MTVLLLRLAGPMQSWGHDARFKRRSTAAHPTKSGVLGLVAAAMGLRRTDSISDLLGLRFGVRVDQPGVVLTDFHTAHVDGPTKPPVVSQRDYLSDAVFLAGLEGSARLVESLEQAFARPRFPLYLGRRSCPVEGQLVLGSSDSPLEEALAQHEWLAAPFTRRHRSREVYLETFVDAPSLGHRRMRDVPISFDSQHRQYTWRAVKAGVVQLKNPQGRRDPGGLVDWLAEVSG